MKLTELQPRWWSAHAGEHAGEHERHGLTFLCPHCKVQRLGCAFSHSPAHLEIDGVMGSAPIWQSTGDTFETLTLSPSVNAGPVHWHGFITNGEVA